MAASITTEGLKAGDVVVCIEAGYPLVHGKVYILAECDHPKTRVCLSGVSDEDSTTLSYWYPERFKKVDTYNSEVGAELTKSASLDEPSEEKL